MFVLDVGHDGGALVVYTSPSMKDAEVEISYDGDELLKKVHTGVVQRAINGQPVCAAVFPSLRAGQYTFWRPQPLPQAAVAIRPGQVVELDWR